MLPRTDAGGRRNVGQTVVVQIPFAGGLNEKLSAHYQDPNAQLASVVNGNFVKANAVDKRLGMGLTTTLPAPTIANPVARVASWSKGDVDVLTQNGLYAVEAASGTSVAVGPLPPAQTIRRPIPISANAIDLLPVVGDLPTATTTLRVVVYTGSGCSVYALVYDTNTQQIVCPPTRIYFNGASTDLALVGNVLYLANAPANEQLAIFFADTTASGSTNQGIYACNYVASSNTFTSPTLIGQAYTGGSALPPVWDVAPFVGDSTGRYLFAYCTTSSEYGLFVVTPNHSTITTGPTVTAPGGYVAGCGGSPTNQIYVYGTAGTGELIWLEYTFTDFSLPTMQLFAAAWGQPGSFPVEVSPTSLITQPALWVIPPLPTSATQAVCGYVLPIVGAGTTTFAGFLDQVSASGSPSYADLSLGYFPIARPFLLNGVMYIPSVLNLGQGSEQGTQYLLQVGLNGSFQGAATLSALPVATSAQRQVDLQSIFNGMGYAGVVVQGPNHIPFGSVANPTSYTAVPIRIVGEDTQSASVNPFTTGNSGLSLSTFQTTYNFDSPLQYQANELGGLLHIQGGTPFVFDGATTYEDNFYYYPEFTTATLVGTGSTIPSSGSASYTYAVVYVYPDSAGLVHRSSPYFTNTVTVTHGGQYPQLSIPELGTWRTLYGQTFCEIYRTIGNPGTTPEFYLLDRVVVGFAIAQGFQTYDDNNPQNSDALLQSSTPLYTSGGVLDRVCPPSCNGQTIHKSRVWRIDDTLQTIWFSEQFSPGDAPGYNEALTITMSDGGDMLALASMDTELVVFKKQSIWVIYGGDGPNQLGQGADETTPVKVPSDVGAQDWRSVVLTPVGVMFAASTGIYLLDRSLGVTFIGAKVQDLFSTYPVCVGAALVPGSTQVRFAMQSIVNPIRSTIIVYDYLLQQWTQHQYAQQTELLNSVGVSQQGVYTVNTEDGCIWQENSAATIAAPYLDDDTTGTPHFSPTSITTAEIKVQGSGPLQAYQRTRWVQLYADQLDPCQVTMALAFNGVSTIVQSETWTWNQLDDLAYDQVAMHVAGAYNKAMSVQVTLTDSADPATVTGQGVRWSGLAIELDALKQRTPQTPPQNRG
jgi:hypothetical protein